jgi:hypothetical protein
VDCYLPYFRQQLITRLLSALLPFQLFVYWKFEWRSVLCPSLLLQCTFSSSVPLLCVSFQFFVYCLVFFFFFCRGESICPGAMLVYPRGGWGNTVWYLALACLVCWMSPQQVWR